jgi:hypothetical protein
MVPYIYNILCLCAGFSYKPLYRCERFFLKKLISVP